MIAVVGASGAVGRALVDHLLARGHGVRALTRRPDALAVPPAVEVVAADAEDPGSLAVALAGATGAFLMSAEPVGDDARPTHVPRLVAAAEDAGVDRVVHLSVFGGGEGDDPIAAWHRAAEAAVTGGRVPATLLRPGRFFSNAARWAPMLRRGDVVHVPFARRAAAGIDPDDIAAVAAVALEGHHEGRALRLTGPETLTAAEEVAILGEVLGRELRTVEVPADRARDGMVAGGVPPAVADAVVRRSTEEVDGSEVLDTVPAVLGRPARTFAQWARAHAALFT